MSKNLDQRIPILFTTPTNVILNSINYCCYDIDLRLHTNDVLLDGSDTDYEHPNMYQNNYSVFMSNRNELSIFAIGGPFEKFYLNQANPRFNQMLCRNSFTNFM